MPPVGRPIQRLCNGGSRRRLGSSGCRGFWSGIFGLGGDSSNNPISDALSGNADGNPTQLPHYGEFQPRHLTQSHRRLQLDRTAAVPNFHVQLRESPPRLGPILHQWHDQFYAPMAQLHIISTAFSMLTDPATQKQWRQVQEEIFQRDPVEMALDGIDASLLQSAISPALPNDSQDDEIRTACTWIQKNLQPTMDSEYLDMEEELEDVEESILKTPDSLTAKTDMSQFLANLRKTMDLKHQMAHSLGYASHVDQILATRMATKDELRRMHLETAEAILPMVELIRHDPFDQRFLKRSNIASPTLNGCLHGVSKVASEIFGVEIVEEHNSDARWNQDARVFHLHERETSTHLGSIILDPYKRKGKLPRAFAIQMRPRTQLVHPVVGLFLDMDPPVWDDAPATMGWDQAESMFHEFGHALQMILARSSLGAMLGAQYLPLDVTEIMPIFLEHWLFEESCLQEVVGFQGQSVLSSEMTATLLEWRRQRSSLQLMQNVYYGALELELFAFDPRGEESLIGLYRRLSTQFSPHDMPAQNDLSPLVQIMKENAGGTALGRYRYFWGEVIAAGLFRSFIPDEKGLFDGSGRVQELGRSLRTEFLDRGAVFDVDKTMREFDGKTLVSTNPLVELLKEPETR